MDSPWGKPITKMIKLQQTFNGEVQHAEIESTCLNPLFEIPGPCECGTDKWTYVIPGNPNTQGAWGCSGCGVFIAVKWLTPKREQRAWIKAK